MLEADYTGAEDCEEIDEVIDIVNFPMAFVEVDLSESRELLPREYPNAIPNGRDGRWTVTYSRV